MINVANANSYFKGNVLLKVWEEYSGEQKSAALLQARRELSMLLGRPLRDDEPAYREGDRFRDEFAAYEQAAYLLIRDSLPEGGGEITPSLDEGKERPVPRAIGGRAVEALKWLTGGRVARTARFA